MLWLQQKYVGLIGPRLRNFRRKGPDLWNFSCSVCGDSTTNLRKARGFIYGKGGGLVYHCHNCGVTMGFPKLLKRMDENLYLEYVKENLQFTDRPEKEDVSAEKFRVDPPIAKKGLDRLKKISQLPHDHPAKRYVDSRMIPPKEHYRLRYCPRFNEWTNSFIPKKMSDKPEHEEPRLIIPLIDQLGQMFGYQGRSFANGPDVIRYITIMLDETAPRVFGLDKLDAGRPWRVFEGPIDSLFISNSLATAGGTPTLEISKLGLIRAQGTFVLDNEPRNRDTVAKMVKAANEGYGVCIWPSYVEHKDVNDMIMSGQYKADEIERIIASNTHRGLAAVACINEWKK